MYRLLKTAHVLGFALFLGSIFGHIVAGVVGGDVGSPDFLVARKTITAATEALTFPGLGLAIASGLGLAAMTAKRRAWLYVHATLAVLAALLSAFVVAPAGRAALVAATSGDFEAARAAIMREHVFGSLSVAITLAIVALGVYKPALTFIATRREKAAATRA